jgi:hypothetical protein
MCFLTDPQYSGAPAEGQGGTWLPGGGQLNPFNPASAAGQAFAGVGQFNIWNPDSMVGKAANDLAKDLGTGLQAIANDPRKLAAVGIMVAFPGAASAIGSYLLPAEVVAAYPTVAAVVGQTALNTATNGGDVKGAVTSALIQQGAPQLTKYIADSYATEGVSKAITDWAAKATTDVGLAAALGKDPASAFIFSGAKAATDVVLNQAGISNTLSMLPKEAASAAKAAITAKIMNIDPSKAVAQDLINQAIGSAKGMVNAQWYAKTNNLTPLTADQLSTVPPEAATDPNQIKNIVSDANAQNGGWRDSYQKSIAAQEGFTDPKEYLAKGSFLHGDILDTGVQGTLYADGKIKLEGENAPRAPTPEEAAKIAGAFEKDGREVPKLVSDALPKAEAPTAKEGKSLLEDQNNAETGNVVDKLVDAGLQENTNVDLNKVVSGTDTTAKPDDRLTQAVDKGKAGDIFGQVNLQREIVGLPPYASLNEFYASKEGKHYLANHEDAATGATGTDTVAGGAGTDTTKTLAGADAYKYDPATKTYTYTSDDGSTLTLDESGTPIGFTEATDTSWTGLTDKDTGNLKLPKLPGGLTPTVKPPAKKTTTTTTTGTGNTAVTTGTGNTAVTTGSNTAVVTGSGTTALNSDQILSLLNVFGGSGGQQQQQVPYTPAQVPVADIKSYYNTIRGIAGERLLDPPEEKKKKSSIEEMFFEGGTVDDLLRILRG